MESLTQLITNLLADHQLIEGYVLFFVAGAVFFSILGIFLLMNNYFDPVRFRFLQDKNAKFVVNPSEIGNQNIYLKYQHLLLPSNEQLINRTTQRLHFAGFHFRRNLSQYFALRFVLALVLPILTFVILSFVPGMTISRYLQGIALGFILGFVGPSFVLDRMIKKRQKIIQRGFPDILDLLVVCSEAGLSLDAALQKVATEISFSQPVLAQELALVIAEIRAGIDRKKALNGLAERTGVDDISGLMSAINQSMRFGSSIADTLRIYADDFRDKRMQAAEEMAAKIGAKLIFPIALCLLPCFILIVLVPFAMSISKTFNL